MQEIILDRYQFLYEAGSGGFASVVVAYDLRIRREVAIKCIPLDEAQTQILPSFDEKTQAIINAGKSVSLIEQNKSLATPGLEEARMAAKLNDSSIVQIYDFEIQDNMAYLIMEYVKGISLATLLREAPELIDSDVIAAVFKSIAHALEVAHGQHVLHLDIKPDNILINSKGQVKVTDFGLAKLADEGGFSIAKGGTIGYMPIEQMRREELDERCDEWALASLTYEMVTGYNPFLAQNLDDAENMIFDAELPIPSFCRDDINESFDEIIFCALEPYRDKRYDTIKEFRKDLLSCLGNPKKGIKKLANFMEPKENEQTEDLSGQVTTSQNIKNDLNTVAYSHLDRPLMRRDPLDPDIMAIWLKIWCVANVCVICFLFFSNISFFGGWASPITWGILVVIVVATIIWPHIGSLLGLLLLAALLFYYNAMIPGIILSIASLAWWFFQGRFSNRQAAIVLSPALFGMIGFCPIIPFIAGWMLRPNNAIITTILAGLVSAVLAGLGSISIFGWDPFQFAQIRLWNVLSDNYLLLLQDPGQWTIFISWILASGLLALFCSHGTRLFSVIGSLSSIALMIFGLAVGSFVERGGTSISIDIAYLAPTIVAGIVIFLLTLWNTPVREDEEEIW